MSENEWKGQRRVMETLREDVSERERERERETCDKMKKK